MRAPQFECAKRHRSFLDRFRIGDTDGHRPRPGTESVRRVEFSEFRGSFLPLRSADCVDCGAPLIYAPAYRTPHMPGDAVADELRHLGGPGQP